MGEGVEFVARHADFGENGTATLTSDTQDLDIALGFTIPERHARGRLARLGPALDMILGAPGYPPAIEKLLAEIPADPSLFALFGKGYLAITFDQALTGERYQGIVPLEGGSLAEAAESYFSQSEQLPSLVRLASRRLPDGRHIAGGILIQHLPEGEEGRDRIHTRLDHPEWDHVRALGETISADELTDPDLGLELLLWRLFNEEEQVRTIAPVALARGCRCDPDHIRNVISRFPAEERTEMADENGEIHVDCEFCAKRFSLSLASL